MSTEAIRLVTASGLSIWTGASLNCMTTYVLLEQGGWFEREWGFVGRWLREGMRAVDIGANYGTYALTMASKVGPSGAVLAFEPAGLQRALLERSRADNGFDNLTISPLAVSDGEGERTFYVHLASELNSLTPSLNSKVLSSETVQVTSLDACLARLNWTGLDFLKIDAEGEEQKILAGAVDTLRDHSPLVMFEASHNTKFRADLPEEIEALGYRRYRLTADGSLLTPWDAEDIDAFTLNVLAAKPDRAAQLAADGFLVEQPLEPRIEDPPFMATWARINALPYSAKFGAARKPGDERYLAAIAAYFVWCDRTRPADERYGALCLALKRLMGLCKYAATPGRLNTLARVASEGGRQDVATEALRRLIHEVEAIPAGEPFIVANPRFDAIAPGADPASWYMAAVLERFELVGRLSTSLNPSDPRALHWLLGSPFATPEIARRLLVQMIRWGERDLDLLERVRRACGPLNQEALDPGKLIEALPQAQ